MLIASKRGNNSAISPAPGLESLDEGQMLSRNFEGSNLWVSSRYEKEDVTSVAVEDPGLKGSSKELETWYHEESL